MKKQIFVTDIGLASILDAYGIPKRQPDCITREVRERDGKNVETGKWWYDVTDGESQIVGGVHIGHRASDLLDERRS